MKKLVLESLSKLDFVIWWITLAFFLGSAFVMWWDLTNTFSGASGIIVLMFFVWLSIELILSSLKNVKWIGKITGFITNWPEALVLIIWLITWDIIFAASTPLGSNFMNPVLLLVALIVTGYIFKLKFFNYKVFFILSFILTWILAISFFQIPESYYIYWLWISLVISLVLFFKKFDAIESEDVDEKAKWYYLPLWIALLLASWYFLDPVVSLTAEASKAPKWLIWFLVLSTLTSWPEFKSVLALLRRQKILDAFINILISNITNLWLAIIWVVIWVFTK